VSQLNTGHCTLLLDEGGNPGQQLDVFVLVNAHIEGRNHAAMLDTGRFHHDQPGAPHGSAAEMH
jgi:hypothetical protein